MVGFQPDTGNLLKSETVDGSTRNPANSPVEVKVVYPITYDLQGFITIPAGEPDFFQQFVFYGWSTYPDSPRLAPLPSGFGGKSLEEWPVAGRRDLGL